MSRYDSFRHKYTAKICVEVADAGGKKSYPAGSGLLISPQHVLTVKHVIDKENRVKDSPIEVYFLDHSKQTNEFFPPFVTDKVFEFPDTDIVVLKLQEKVFEDSSEIPFRLSGSMFDALKQERWSSSGFPRYIKDTDIVYKPFGGNFSSAANDARLLDVTSDLTLDDSQSWKGVSGSVVTFGDLIYGVLEGKQEKEVNGFQMFSVSYLFSKVENSRFKEFYSEYLNSLEVNDYITEERNAKKVVIDYVCAKLKTDSVFKESLLEVQQVWSDKQDLKIAFELCDAGVSLVLGLFNKVLELKSPSLDEKRFNALAKVLYSIGSWFLILSLKENWRALCNFEKQRGVERLELQEKLFAEVVVSRSLLKEPEFKLDEQGNPAQKNPVKNLAVFSSSFDSNLEFSILKEIYRDFKGGIPKESESPDEIANAIIYTVQQRIKSGRRTAEWLQLPVPPPFVYYLINGESYEIISKNQFSNDFNKLISCIRFLSVGNGPNNISKFVDKDLLEELIEIRRKMK